ncbi:glycosyltransferase [Pseudomonas sp. NMI795_08]|uniref:glycosyltransferase n=1 Tax=Pseudomonas sp. NMI795_08 TaxID=2903144 RepID=UPI001E4C128B|nr:glycosyltransferase [Pseudomonas sp. NMI795_08]MCE1119009.1 glycosyltransferase [Pseudomonas sp. NMI795_08]
MSKTNSSAPPPRILLCVHQFFPTFSAGTEVLVLSTAKALREVGYEVRIVTGAVTSAPKVSTDTYNFQDFTVHRISSPYQHGSFDAETVLKEYENDEISPYFAGILDTFSPDLVHFFHFRNLTLSCLQACLDRSIPTAFTPTDFWLACRTCQLLKPWGQPECKGPERLAGNCLRHILINSKRRPLVNLAKVMPGLLFSTLALLTKSTLLKHSKLNRLSTDLMQRESRILSHLEKIDLLLPPTRSLLQRLQAGGIAATKIVPLRYAIEPPVVDDHIIATSKSQQPFIVGFIGTLVEHKGCHVLLSALKKVPSRNIEVRIYGDTQHYPAYVDTLMSIADNDERIRFLGTFPPDTIGNVLNELDALIIPSTWRENAPLVLLNAIASATPVIASDAPGITEYLSSDDDVTLFPSGDSRKLAQLLVERCHTGRATGKKTSPVARVAGSALATYANILDSAYNRLIQRPYKKMDKT